MIFEELKQMTHTIWGSKGLYGEITNSKQSEKLIEEAQEVKLAFENEGTIEQKTEIGDCLTVIINLCRMNGFTPEECLYFAYMKNKNREGAMLDGEFLHTEKE